METCNASDGGLNEGALGHAPRLAGHKSPLALLLPERGGKRLPLQALLLAAMPGPGGYRSSQ